MSGILPLDKAPRNISIRRPRNFLAPYFASIILLFAVNCCVLPEDNFRQIPRDYITLIVKSVAIGEALTRHPPLRPGPFVFRSPPQPRRYPGPELPLLRQLVVDG